MQRLSHPGFGPLEASEYRQAVSDTLLQHPASPSLSAETVHEVVTLLEAAVRRYYREPNRSRGGNA
jgi:hypothetical protein